MNNRLKARLHTAIYMSGREIVVKISPINGSVQTYLKSKLLYIIIIVGKYRWSLN